jgi:hypothetical protein
MQTGLGHTHYTSLVKKEKKVIPMGKSGKLPFCQADSRELAQVSYIPFMHNRLLSNNKRRRGMNIRINKRRDYRCWNEMMINGLPRIPSGSYGPDPYTPMVVGLLKMCWTLRISRSMYPAAPPMQWPGYALSKCSPAGPK